MSSAPPLPSPPPHSSPPSLLPSPVPSRPSPPLPILPSLRPYPFPSLSSPPFPSLPLSLKRGSGGLPPENFEILDCCRWVLAHSGMQKGVCKGVYFLGRTMKFFWPQSRGRSPPSPPPPPWIRRWRKYGEIFRFSTESGVYPENGTRKSHRYHGSLTGI